MTGLRLLQGGKNTHKIGRNKLVVGVKPEADHVKTSPWADFHFVDFRSITPELIADIQPEIVFSPLFGSGYDAIDIAHLLADTGFDGQYLALCAPMPDTDMIKTEVGNAVPGLYFDVLSLGARRTCH